jgi:hypothetical protein
MLLEAELASLNSTSLRLQMLAQFPLADEIEIELSEGSVLLRSRLMVSSDSAANSTLFATRAPSVALELSSRFNVTVVPSSLNSTVHAELSTYPNPDPDTVQTTATAFASNPA